MKSELAYNILGIFQTMKDAAGEMRRCYAKGNMDAFWNLCADIGNGLAAIQQIARQEIPEGNKHRLADACTCALESLGDIKEFVVSAPGKVEWKLEHELASIIEAASMQLFYRGIVEGCPEKTEEFQEFLAGTDAFEILQVPEDEWEYEYDLTVMVLAYNHLDYTKICLQSVLEQLPKDIKIQLLLCNHGSHDGTKEYFESIKDANTINIAVNGAVPGYGATAAARGKYYLFVSNDIVIGENAILNLYRCVSEHPEYGSIVPTTPNVSNLQSIPGQYDSTEQFHQFTAENNRYDERRHEERVRLCNPIQMIPTRVYFKMLFDLYLDLFCENSFLAFPDDRLSLWMRRKGYRNILAKDAFCHHFGSVTIKQEQEREQSERKKFYREGMNAFRKKYGVDPWGVGGCYDEELFQEWEIPAMDNAAVLGINCGLGSNSLKVKEVLREKGAHGAVLYNATQAERYILDLQGISDEAFVIRNLEEIAPRAGRAQFDYIVVEGLTGGRSGGDQGQAIREAGLAFGELAWKTASGEWKIMRGNQ